MKNEAQEKLVWTPEPIDDDERRMLVGGEWVKARSGQAIRSVDPSTEGSLGQIPAGDTEDIDDAVRAAKLAFPAWADSPWQDRARLLRTLASRIRERAEAIARLDVSDSGNPINGMRRDVLGAADELEFFAGLASETKGASLPKSRGQLVFSEREPFGVVGRIIPFNHPFKFAAGKIAAPLAAGNTVVLKPDENTSLSALELGRLVEDVLPPGVLNIVTGHGSAAGAALAAHPDVPRIAFTGGVATGRAVAHAGADRVKTVSLELGGKNPMIVFPDADARAAAKAAVAAMNLRRSTGQSCQSSSRIFVHQELHAAFLEHLVGLVEALRVGDPHSEDTDMGPLSYMAHYERVCGYVSTGLAEGARLLTGGGRPAHLPHGYFLSPTVFSEVTPSMTIAREEIFGPVISVIRWDDQEEMLAAVEDVEYGLTANIWTTDPSLALRTARRIQAGLIWINGSGRRPFGAPLEGFKQSGHGIQGSIDELLSYTRSKTIVYDLGESAPESSRTKS